MRAAGGRSGRRALLGVAALSLAFLPAACGGGASHLAQAESPRGCYRFEEGEGAEALRLPWGFLLKDQALEGRWPLMERFDSVWAARTLREDGEPTDHPFGYWRITPSDSVEVGHPGGGGVVLVLGEDEEALVGRGRSAGDALPPGAEPDRRAYDIRAVRVDCSEAGVPGGGS